jgi:DNA-binding NarL/FixJ family response regulator
VSVPIRLLLADDHQLVRESLRALLEREGYEVVAEAGDGREAVRLARELSPDLAVLDVAMPLLDGLEAARQLERVAPRTKTVLLTTRDEDQVVAGALSAGVKGYVLKTQAARDLLRALDEVVRGAVYLSPRVAHVLVDLSLGRRRLGVDPLTSREREVLHLIAEGRTTKQVASALGIGVKTAESHRSRLMKKLDIHEVAGLVLYAIRRGVIQP